MKKKDNNDLLPISDDEFVQRKPKKTFKNAILKVTNTALVLGMVAEVGLMGRWTFVFTNNFIKNEDIIPEASESLSADISILERDELNNAIVKLKPNIYNKVYVYIDNNVPERARKNIEESLEYFNEIFADINTKYHFEVCDKATYLANSILFNSVVSFEYETLENTKTNHTYGEARSSGNKPFIMETLNKDWYYSNVYLIKNQICLNDMLFDELTDKTQKQVICHEMMHALGIDDTYEGYFEEASLMNPSYASLIEILSPKDLSRLYILYDEELIGENNTINEKEMARVKEKIADYEKEYYGKLVNEILEKAPVSNLEEITDDDLAGFDISKFNIDISVNDDNTFTYSSKSEANKTRTFIRGENYVVLPDIKVTDEYEDYLLLLKIDGKLGVYNFSIITNQGNENLSPIEDTRYFIY